MVSYGKDFIFKLGVKKEGDSCNGLRTKIARLSDFLRAVCFFYHIQWLGNFLCRALSDEPLAALKTKLMRFGVGVRIKNCPVSRAF